MTRKVRQPARPPDRAPRAAVGWGDLLAFRQLETNPAQRAEAARLLGLPDLGPGLFDHLKPPEKPKKPKSKKPPPPPTNSKPIPRVPLTCPQLLVARVVPPTEPGESPPKPEPLPDWSEQEANEVEGMLLPTDWGQRIAPCLWPLEATRKAVRSASHLHQGVCLDLPRLLKRLAGAQWPYPFPQRARRSQSRHLVLLMDWREDLTLFQNDFSRLFHHLKRQLHGVEVECDWLLSGPAGELWSKERPETTRRPWSANTTLVLVSDLGGADPWLAARWQRYLRALRRKLGAVMVLNPLQTGVADPADGVSADQLDSLLSALSPAITVEPTLIRAMRLAVVPDSSPALEAAVWRHPDLVGALPYRQWRVQKQNQWLDRLHKQPASVRAKVAETLHAFHDHVCPLQRDDEWVLWGRVIDDEVLTLSCECIGEELDIHGARCRGEQVARHLWSLTNGDSSHFDGRGERQGAALVSLKANERLQRFATSTAHLSTVTVRCLLAAAAKNGEPLELPAGVSSPLDLMDKGSQHDPKGLLFLYQIGRTIWLVREISDWGMFFGLGYPEGKKQVELEFIQRTKPRLASLVVEGEWLEWIGPSGRKLLPLRALFGPTKLAEWEGTLSDAMQLKWRGGALEIIPIDRVQGSTGWQLNASEAGCAELRLDAGSPLFSVSYLLHDNELEVQAPNKLGSKAYWLKSLGAVERGHELGGAQWVSIGIDECGVFAEMSLRNFGAPNEVFETINESIRLRYIPPGTFLMGSPDGEGNSNEHPQHPVTLTEGFWLAEAPCTQALWQVVMGSNPSEFSQGADAPRRPVENVSHEDVTQFLKKLTGLLPKGVQAVLPTEAQWEYAARAGTQTAYWWGDRYEIGRGANVGGRKGRTTTVGAYEANPWGLYDMHGNVWEWCADDRRTYASKAEVNPGGDTKGAAFAVRGGSWLFPPGHARAAYRSGGLAGERDHFQGFRFALRSSSPGPEGGA